MIRNAAFLLLAVVLLLLPQNVWAYSYGDPNKEDLAEAYPFIEEKLTAPSPDWQAAYQQFLNYKQEIALHFNEAIANEIDADFKQKNKALVLGNYQGLLVMNLQRRFKAAEADLANYTQSKLLLAKARGTFAVLSPKVQAKSSVETVKQIEHAFDLALEALGNPGLFGVGKKEMNAEEFKKRSAFIFMSVKPLFSFQLNGKSIDLNLSGGVHRGAPAPGSGIDVSEKEAKTNPLITVLLIGGVVAIAGLGWYAARKKGLL